MMHHLDDDDLNRLLFGDQLNQIGGVSSGSGNSGLASTNLLTVGASSTTDNMVLSSSICMGEELSWCAAAGAASSSL